MIHYKAVVGSICRRSSCSLV